MTRTRALMVVIVIQFACLGYLFVRVIGAVNAIQANRVSLCEAANHRHQKVLAVLHDEIKTAEKHVSAKRLHRIEASVGPTILLINAIVPYQDCEAVVNGSN